MRALYDWRLRDRKSMSPTAKTAKPIVRIVGSAEAVFGAIAPFENVVVCAGAGVGAGTSGDSGGGGLVIATAVSAVSDAVASAFAFPAAESTHAFMSESVIRPEESAFDLVAVDDVRFAVSTGGLRGDGA